MAHLGVYIGLKFIEIKVLSLKTVLDDAFTCVVNCKHV